MNERWKQKAKPASLEARFEFDSFDKLRDFLDAAAEGAEKLDHHPNISFSREHASFIIYAKTGELTDVDFNLQQAIDQAYETVVTS